ncbi:mechanosensitive ion channel family protein [Methylovirgula sp. 4M-Z18]|uniref:mechanosensitive ion channel family protein n=1 Tax=Methylovirgula sp. 4M-Z18 TaxID=2293567 RepID=UPI000E2ED1F0|nr:mechanosensitive ion channel domain-containing protein [Methylovirgula sp. 4M-Z18]RFB79663.1 hypothetical protein DYH55_09265 [Methylovirgula sp. 4M-Z18]
MITPTKLDGGSLTQLAAASDKLAYAQTHIFSRIVAFLQAARQHLHGLLDDFLGLFPQTKQLVTAFETAVASSDGVKTYAYLLILIIAGASIEWLYRSYAFGALRALEAAVPNSPLQALSFGLRLFAIKLFALLLFAIVVVALSISFAWPPGVQDAVLTLTLWLFLVRLASLILQIVTAPNAPRLRLLPMSDLRVRWLDAMTVITAGTLSAGWLLSDLIDRNAADAAHVAGSVRFIAATSVTVLLLAVIGLWVRMTRARARIRGIARPQMPVPFFVTAIIIATYALWLIGADTMAGTVAVLALMLAAERLLRQVVGRLWPAVAVPAPPPEPHHEQEPEEVVSFLAVLPGVVLRIGRLVIAMSALAACALIWNLPVMEMPASDSLLGKATVRLLGVIALFLAADAVIAAVRAAIDSRISAVGPVGHEGNPGPNARLLTLLPLARKALVIVVSAIFLLSILSVLGIDIAPLLAGASVVGIAIGFGAQTLVRDVISGIFYLLEDVFRVGEYIEGGAGTRGTVERITLRSVALRHHNGPLHYVPYGVLGAVRNNSRDWVIEKFNIPLPLDTDSEMVRKLIKAVGEELLQDEEFGPYIIEPLKGRLYRVEPGLKLFRCKFMSLPGKQFEVRAAAYRYLEQALIAAGVHYANPMPQLMTVDPNTLTAR